MSARDMELTLQTGDLIAGKYRVERLLGTGGMGSVVAVRHVQLKRQFALKLLHPRHRDNAIAMTRFEREARTAARLTSEHVGRVVDVGVLDDGAPFMVMEYLEGRDLQTVLDAEGRLRGEDAVEYILQISEALAEAHSLGIIHRDLKPANLFLTQRVDGTPLVKVLDFGISKITGEDLSLTSTRDVMGTPHFMSPEQFQGSREVDARSDIWSLGAVLYTLLAGTTPFTGDSLGQLCARVLTQEPADLREVRPELPTGLELVVARCLRKAPEERFQSVAEVASALDPYSRHEAPRGAARVVAASQRPSADGTSAPAPKAVDQERRPGSMSRTMLERLSTALAGVDGASRRGWRVLFAGIAVLVLVLSGLAGRHLLAVQRTREQPARVVTQTDAGIIARPTAGITPRGLPLPVSNNPAALAAFTEGLAALQDADSDLAEQKFERALALDGDLAAARFRLALVSVREPSKKTGELFSNAMRVRAALSERDQLFMDALSPAVLADPPNYAEAVRRLRALETRLPGDVEIVLHRTSLQRYRYELADALTSIEGMIPLAPDFAALTTQRIGLLIELGHYDEAAISAADCEQRLPQASECSWLRATVEGLTGDCRSMLDTATRWRARQPQSTQAHRWMAKAFVAAGMWGAAREALRLAESVLPADANREGALVDTVRLELAEGDFSGAITDAENLLERESTSSSLVERLVPLHWLLQAAIESKRSNAATRSLDRYLEVRAALPGRAVMQPWRDMRLALADAARRMGRISLRDFDTERSKWLVEWRQELAPPFGGTLWTLAYAQFATNEDEARRAVDVLPEYAPLPQHLHVYEAGVGRTLLLAGRTDDAIPYLERAARSCLVFDNPVAFRQARYDLGVARERQRDTVAACEAYASLASVWSRAKVHSRTLDQVSRHMSRLHCPSAR